jgi:hypothetical protein
LYKNAYRRLLPVPGNILNLSCAFSCRSCGIAVRRGMEPSSPIGVEWG